MTNSSIGYSGNSFIQGFMLCISLIIVFGPQNLFLLRQGIRRRHLFATASVSTLADVVLITVAVSGIGMVVSFEGPILEVITTGSALILLGYGLRSLLSTWRTRTANDAKNVPSILPELPATVAATLSFSLLNPASYLDTLVIIGSKSALVPSEQRFYFGLGAMLASAFWFFTLTYGAGRLAPLFRHPATWRTLDGISGGIMVGIAGKMAAAVYHLW